MKSLLRAHRVGAYRNRHGSGSNMLKTTSRTEIEKLDGRITRMVENALIHAGSLRFSRICHLDDSTTIRDQTYPGLYFIEVRVNLARHETVTEWASWFKDRWDNDRPRGR